MIDNKLPAQFAVPDSTIEAGEVIFIMTVAGQTLLAEFVECNFMHLTLQKVIIPVLMQDQNGGIRMDLQPWGAPFFRLGAKRSLPMTMVAQVEICTEQRLRQKFKELNFSPAIKAAPANALDALDAMRERHAKRKA